MPSGGKSKAATSNCQRCFIFLPCHPENQFCNIVVFVTNKGIEKSYAAEVKGIFENAASIPGTSSICCISIYLKQMHDHRYSFTALFF